MIGHCHSSQRAVLVKENSTLIFSAVCTVVVIVSYPCHWRAKYCLVVYVAFSTMVS